MCYCKCVSVLLHHGHVHVSNVQLVDISVNCKFAEGMLRGRLITYNIHIYTSTAHCPVQGTGAS